MDNKPRKPDPKAQKPIKPLDEAVALSKNTPADTKALMALSKELKSATKTLGGAQQKSYQKFNEAFALTAEIAKSPPAGPIPIPYPVIAKSEKATKSATQATEKAQKKYHKAAEKFIKLAEKEIKKLQASAKKGNGDEAGTLKGLVSAKTMVKAQMLTFSIDVKAECHAVGRHFDMVYSNLKKADK